MSWLNDFDRYETNTTKTTVKSPTGKQTTTSTKTTKTFSGVAFVFAIIAVFLIAVSMIRNFTGAGSEPLTFSALLEILSTCPTFDFGSFAIPSINLPDWLSFIEFALNFSIQIINIIVWIVGNIGNFISYLAYFAYHLLGLNLGF